MPKFTIGTEEDFNNDSQNEAVHSHDDSKNSKQSNGFAFYACTGLIYLIAGIRRICKAVLDNPIYTATAITSAALIYDAYNGFKNSKELGNIIIASEVSHKIVNFFKNTTETLLSR